MIKIPVVAPTSIGHCTCQTHQLAPLGKLLERQLLRKLVWSECLVVRGGRPWVVRISNAKIWQRRYIFVAMPFRYGSSRDSRALDFVVHGLEASLLHVYVLWKQVCGTPAALRCKEAPSIVFLF